MKRLIILAALSLAGCAPGYTSAEFVYREPVEYEYYVPVDRVVVVTQDVLVTRGWTVYRVEHSGPDRIIWARRGDDEVVRIFATPYGEHNERVAVRGLWEQRDRRHGDDDDQGDDDHDRGRHRGWRNRGQPRDIITAIDVRLRARGQ